MRKNFHVETNRLLVGAIGVLFSIVSYLLHYQHVEIRTRISQLEKEAGVIKINKERIKSLYERQTRFGCK